MQILDPSGAVATSQTFDNQAMTAGTVRSFSLDWTAPFTAPVGAYTAQAVVSAAGSSTPLARGTVAAFTVKSPTITSSASSSPATVARGQTAAITLSVRSDVATTVIVLGQIYSSSGTLMAQQAFDNVALAAGQTTTLTMPWTVPSTAATGTYALKIGTFNPGWGVLVSWNDAAGSVGVK